MLWSICALSGLLITFLVATGKIDQETVRSIFSAFFGKRFAIIIRRPSDLFPLAFLVLLAVLVWYGAYGS